MSIKGSSSVSENLHVMVEKLRSLNPTEHGSRRHTATLMGPWRAQPGAHFFTGVLSCRALPSQVTAHSCGLREGVVRGLCPP